MTCKCDCCFVRQLSSEWEATRIEALHWMSTLLAIYYSEVIDIHRVPVIPFMHISMNLSVYIFLC